MPPPADGAGAGVGDAPKTAAPLPSASATGVAVGWTPPPSSAAERGAAGTADSAISAKAPSANASLTTVFVDA